MARDPCGACQKVRKASHVSEDELPPEQVVLRMNNAVRRALNTPPKPHDEMKRGKSKNQIGPKDKAPRRGRSK
jgi:hypothetical protein